jgi:hypothetical protein
VIFGFVVACVENPTSHMHVVGNERSLSTTNLTLMDTLGGACTRIQSVETFQMFSSMIYQK